MPNTQGTTGQVLTAPVMPRVNLMPKEIEEAARFRRFQLAMGGAVVAAIAIVGALYVHAHSGVSNAQSQVDAAQAENTQLSTQLSSLSSVADVYAQVASKQAMLQQAMGGEVRWSYILTDLSLKVPDNVWLTNLQAQQTVTGLENAAAPAPVATGTTPLAATTIATVNWTGIAFSHNDVATWLDALAREKGFVNPYFTNSTENFIGPKKTVNMTGTVGLTADAKSGRYNKSAGS
jgi:Tfp pilus assembly protein PilN